MSTQGRHMDIRLIALTFCHHDSHIYPICTRKNREGERGMEREKRQTDRDGDENIYERNRERNMERNIAR